MSDQINHVEHPECDTGVEARLGSGPGVRDARCTSQKPSPGYWDWTLQPRASKKSEITFQCPFYHAFPSKTE